jgi:hypothetical protein
VSGAFTLSWQCGLVRVRSRFALTDEPTALHCLLRRLCVPVHCTHRWAGGEERIVLLIFLSGVTCDGRLICQTDFACALSPLRTVELTSVCHI